MELDALQDAYDDITSAGGSIVGLSPEQPQFAQDTHERHELSFPLLYDRNNRVARAYGLVWDVGEELRPVFESVLDVNISEHNGVESHEIPMPATYVVDERQNVVDCFVHEDYSQRMEPADIVDAVKQANG